MTAEGFVLLFFAQHHLLVACHDTMADIRQRSAAHTDGMLLAHIVGNGTQGRHGTEGLSLEVEVEPCHDDAHTAGRKFLTDIHNARVEELCLVNAYHLIVASHQ